MRQSFKDSRIADPDTFKEPTPNTFDHLKLSTKKSKKSRNSTVSKAVTMSHQEIKMIELSGVYPQEEIDRPSQTHVGLHMKHFYGVEGNKSASSLPITAANFLHMKKGLYLNTFKFSNKCKRGGSRIRNK